MPEKFDKEIRQKLETASFGFNDSHWEEMEKLLDQNERKPIIAVWWPLLLVGFICLGIGGLWFADWGKMENQDISVQQENTTQDKTINTLQSTPLEKNRKAETTILSEQKIINADEGSKSDLKSHSTPNTGKTIKNDVIIKSKETLLAKEEIAKKYSKGDAVNDEKDQANKSSQEPEKEQAHVYGKDRFNALNQSELKPLVPLQISYLKESTSENFLITDQANSGEIDNRPELLNKGRVDFFTDLSGAINFSMVDRSASPNLGFAFSNNYGITLPGGFLASAGFAWISHEYTSKTVCPVSLIPGGNECPDKSSGRLRGLSFPLAIGYKIHLSNPANRISIKAGMNNIVVIRKDFEYSYDIGGSSLIVNESFNPIGADMTYEALSPDEKTGNFERKYFLALGGSIEFERVINPGLGFYLFSGLDYWTQAVWDDVRDYSQRNLWSLQTGIGIRFYPRLR